MRRRHSGFSLVEVMVALIVVSIGMLGIAKMQALALANTSSSRMRSLAAIAAASLGATMRADRNYWASTVANFAATVSANGAVASTSDSALNSTRGARQTCTSTATPCTAVQMAAADLGDWADNVVYAQNSYTATGNSPLLTNGSTTINCTGPQPTATPPTPATCTITMSWNESRVASNGVASAADKNALQSTAPTVYTLRVNP